MGLHDATIIMEVANMYIGGLLVDKLPCNCNAPYAQTGMDNDGTIRVILHDVTNGRNVQLFSNINPENGLDDLNMVCTRCGWSLGN
jgi:hypothetical protein